ncbi:hypothetical protein LSAT2_014012 [Lamellibrachia satsuma]|nr:hypothetical protein LSAT2_014012 [Lamellibrachia satsuma]
MLECCHQIKDQKRLNQGSEIYRKSFPSLLDAGSGTEVEHFQIVILGAVLSLEVPLRSNIREQQPPTRCFNQNKVKTVEDFTYLSGSTNNEGIIDNELNCRFIHERVALITNNRNSPRILRRHLDVKCCKWRCLPALRSRSAYQRIDHAPTCGSRSAFDASLREGDVDDDTPIGRFLHRVGRATPVGVTVPV